MRHHATSTLSVLPPTSYGAPSPSLPTADPAATPTPAPERSRARAWKRSSLAASTWAFAAALAAFTVPSLAEASEPKRSGGQVDILVGGSACIPARGDCKFDDGRRMTRPSAGLGFDIGWRAHKAFFLGAGYTVGWFTPTWRVGDNNDREYRNAYQQGAFLVLRAYIPVWIIDIGFELSPGWSQATFVAENSDLRHLSHGFALRPGFSFDFRLGRHLYVGARIDVPLSFHTRFCEVNGGRDCGAQPSIRQLPVHQIIGGVHLGANF